jgi:preprotein translocase subunit YajC
MNTLLAKLANLPLLLGVPFGGGGQGGQGGQGGGSGQLVTTIITFGLVIGIFYFLIIRPQQKKKKEAANMLGSLRKNDKVATIGGIRGVVQSVKENTVVVKVDDNVKLEFSKNAISNVLERRDEEQDAPQIDEGKST